VLQQLDRDPALEPRIAREEYLAHPSAAERTDQLVASDLG